MLEMKAGIFCVRHRTTYLAERVLRAGFSSVCNGKVGKVGQTTRPSTRSDAIRPARTEADLEAINRHQEGSGAPVDGGARPRIRPSARNKWCRESKSRRSIVRSGVQLAWSLNSSGL